MAGDVRRISWTTSKGVKKQGWLADYSDQHGKRQRKQFKTQAAADSWLLRARCEVRDGIYTPDNARTTVKQAAEEWLRRAALDNLRRGSQRTYEQLVRLAIVPLLGDVRLARLTRPMVGRFSEDLLVRFSRVRARQALSVLCMVLGYAQDRGDVAQNVAQNVRLKIRSQEKEQLTVGRTIPTPDEVRRLLDETEGWLHVMILMAVHTGMREGELRGLHWEDVDLSNKRVSVARNADQWGALGLPKSEAGQRTIALAPRVVTELRRWRLASGHPVLVFPGQDGRRPISPSHVTRSFADLQKTPASGAKYTFHALRHFFASMMIDLGYTSKWLQVTIGHKNITMTLGTYGHLFTNRDGENARMLALEDAVLKGGQR